MPAHSIWKIGYATQEWIYQVGSFKVYIYPVAFKTPGAIIKHVVNQGLVQTEVN